MSPTSDDYVILVEDGSSLFTEDGSPLITNEVATMTYQSNSNITVAAKRESVTGVANSTVTGAIGVRIVGSTGLSMKRAPIQSQEISQDGVMPMGRLGGKSVDGSFSTEMSVGGAFALFTEAVMRSTWATSTAIGFATMTTVAIATNEVVAAGGSWLTQGIRVGDIFRVSGTTVSGNNNTNNIVTAVTTLTISTVTGAFTTLAATPTGTLTILPKLVTATSPTRVSHTIEQYDEDTDLTELFLGCRCVGAKFSFKPNQMATAEYTFMGMDRTLLATGTSPWFTSPTYTTGLALIADDSSIRFNGATVATFNGFDLEFSIDAAGENVLGSFVSPDIFDNRLTVRGTITGLRADFSKLTLYDAETEFEVSILLQEPATAPKPCIAFFVPRAKISALSAPVGGGDGPKVETLELMIGPKVAATGYDGTVVSISSSSSS